MENELAPEILLGAYSQGLFPMGDEFDQIRWYSPDPRTIIDLEHFHVPKRLARTLRHNPFRIAINENFSQVILACSRQKSQPTLKNLLFRTQPNTGVWITNQIIDAYTNLHRAGFAHSVEAYKDDALVGGLYGVTIGGAFMGESMFHIARDASKVCLAFLVEHLKARGYTLLDCQYMTSHLRTFGAEEIPRYQYLEKLTQSLQLNCTFTL